MVSGHNFYILQYNLAFPLKSNSFAPESGQGCDCFDQQSTVEGTL